MSEPTRAECNVRWIERYCRYPRGYRRAGFVALTKGERHLLRQIYDGPDGPQSVPVTGALSAYLVLLHTCGIEATQKDFMPDVSADIFTIWNAAGPDLRAVLKRKGESIVCAGLGTSYSPRAA
jgi:hypothetical protein